MFSTSKPVRVKASPVSGVISTPHLRSPKQVSTTSDLEDLIIGMGKDPSLNLIAILDFCPGFLGCEHVNYVDNSSSSSSKPIGQQVKNIPVPPFNKTLTLYGLNKECETKKLQIILSLLCEQERRMRDLQKTKSLKEYSRSLFEFCPDGIVVTDAGGYIVNTNRAMVSMTRKPKNSLIGLRVSQLTTREGRSTAFTALRQLKTSSNSHFECRMKVGANRTIPISINFTDFQLYEQPLIIAIVRDLSYLEEEMIRCTTYEDSLARSIANATDGFIRYDQFGRISEVNPYIEKMTGLLGGHLMGRPVDDLLTDESLRNFRQAVTQLNKTGYASFDCSVRNSNGKTTPARGTLMQLEVDGERYCRLLLQAYSQKEAS